ncbi:MAG: hypothetical protein U0Q16_03865 [Bryobacteraceae bacterium]
MVEVLLHDAGSLLLRLALFGPVVFLGLRLIVDPGPFVPYLDELSRAIQRFNSALRREPIRVLDSDPDEGAMLLRFSGFVLAAFGVLLIFGPMH